MKRSEIALIVVVAIISLVFAYVLGNMLLGDPSEEVTKIEYLQKIDNGIVAPNDEFFNAYAYNPTVEIYVGNCGTGEVWNELTLECEKEKTEEDEDSDANNSENNTNNNNNNTNNNTEY